MCRVGPILTAALMVAVGMTGCEFDTNTEASDQRTTIMASDDGSAVISSRGSRHKLSRASREGNSLGRIAAAPARVRAEDRRATEPTVLVSGSVKFDDGRPVTSATVELWLDGSAQAGRDSNDRRLDVSPVDARGHYAVAGRDGSGLHVDVKGLSRAVADIAGSDTESTAPVVRKISQDFIIPAPKTVTGRVTDANDNPVTAALVSLRSEDAITDGWYYGNQQTTVTATGEFTLTGVATGNASIGATAEGYSPVTTEISVPTTGPVNLRLSSGSSVIDGYVLMFPGNTPVANATVSIRPAGKIATLGLSAASGSEAVTDLHGTFRLEHLPPGQHFMAVKDSAGKALWSAPGEADDAMAPTLVDNQTTAITLVVFPGYTITGTVFDKDTSEPLSGANVRVVRSDRTNAEATSDEEGQYSLKGMDSVESRAYLAPTLEGYTLAAVNGVAAYSAGRNIQVELPKDSDRVARDIPMVPVVHISGRVQNQEQLPVAGAKIEWLGNLAYSGQGEIKTATNADGLFTFEILPFQEGIIDVTAEGYAFHRTDSMRISNSDMADIVITLDPESTIDGRVVGPEGKPVGGAEVSRGDRLSIGTHMRITTKQLAVSKSDGSFHIDGLEAGRIVLSAKADGFSAGQETLDMVEGEHKSGVVIELGAELTIEGRVVDGNDKPVKAWVSFQTGFMGAPGETTTTNEDGEFTLGGLAPGKTKLFAFAQNPQRSKDVEVEAGAKDVVIRLGGETVIHCKVIDGLTRDPIVDFKVTGVGETFTDGEGPGGFRLTLEPGHSTGAHVSANGYTTKTFKVEAPTDGSSKEVIMEMGIGSGVSGRVVSQSTGDPLEGIPVVVHEVDNYSQASVANSVSDSDGKFLVSKVPSGKVRVTAMPAEPLAPASKETELEDGEFKDVGDIAIGESCSISGTVRERGTGEVPKNITMVLNGPQRGRSMSNMKALGADGTFEFSNLPPGVYDVAANSVSQKVDLKSGDKQELTFMVGGIEMRGTITILGETTSTEIRARNLQTNQVSRGSQSPGKGYVLHNLEPGSYEIIISKSNFPLRPVTPLHTEQFNVPDQDTVQKDFVVP